MDNLLTRGGLESMMSTVALVLCALTFGGIMERTGLLRRLADAILRRAHSTGSLVLATLSSCIGTNVIAPDQYMSIIVPGRMYRETFEERGLAPVNLSRGPGVGRDIELAPGALEYLRCVHVDDADGVCGRLFPLRVREPAHAGDRGDLFVCRLSDRDVARLFTRKLRPRQASDALRPGAESSPPRFLPLATSLR